MVTATLEQSGSRDSTLDFVQDIRWRPGIGDPTTLGWLTVVAYFATALLAGWVGLRARSYFPSERRSRNRLLWLGVAACLIALGFNKQLDLQSLFTDIGRTFSHRQGWYDQRRSVQKLFALGLGALGFTLFLVMAWKLRRSLRTHWLLLFGACFLLSFLLVRAVSFHHFDRFLNLRLFGWRMNWILELTGIACIALQGIMTTVRARQLVPGIAPTAISRETRE